MKITDRTLDVVSLYINIKQDKLLLFRALYGSVLKNDLWSPPLSIFKILWPCVTYDVIDRRGKGRGGG